MDLRLSPQELEFRDQLRDWLQVTLPGLDPRPADDDFAGRRAWEADWQRRLFEAGYAGIHWPEEFGGRGATPFEHLLYIEESQRAGAPDLGCMFVGQQHAGPTLILEATDEQKARHLGPILRGDEVWCQGFSEPGAGSDLASLRTRAIRDGDHYVISGQKIWTTFAQIADYCELLVRTDTEAPKHRGITWVACAMDTPGIDVRPIRTASGGAEFCEVFFDEVRVPVANRVGAENDGWRVAMVTFSFERGTGFVNSIMRTNRELASLADLARRVTRRRGTAWDDVGIRREIGRLQAELDALWALTKRNVSQAARTGTVGPGGSVFKLYYADVLRRMGELAQRVLGRLSIAHLPDVDADDLTERRLTALTMGIAAGTSQVQRNIIGERVLGLPKER
jgi:alkylation response protein AidB-like acyl-CoA dehydrogenase